MSSPEWAAQALQSFDAVVQATPGFRSRGGQRRMAEQVAHTFSQAQLGKVEEGDGAPARAIAVIQAGTGVGKSLAYSAPAIALALARNTRVLISTARSNDSKAWRTSASASVSRPEAGRPGVRKSGAAGAQAASDGLDAAPTGRSERGERAEEKGWVVTTGRLGGLATTGQQAALSLVGHAPGTPSPARNAHVAHDEGDVSGMPLG